MALDSMIQVQEQPIILQYTKQGIQGATGATGPQGRDGDVWELRLTMTNAPDGTLMMELYQNGELCPDQHFASVMYMTNNGTGYELSNEWSKNFTSTYSFTYQGMRSFFVTVYDDAFKEKVICHNSVNYGKAATIEVGNVQQGGTAQVTNSGTVYNAILDFVLPKGDTATVSIGKTTTLPAGSQATVENVGTANDAILNFGIPNGGGSGARVETNSEGNNIILDAGAIYTPSVSTDGVMSWTNNAGLPNPPSVRISINPKGAWSQTGTYTRFDTVLYNGSTYMALKDVAAGTVPTSAAYWILLVEKGEMGTVEIGTTTTGEPGTDASVVNSGTNTAAVLDFTIPRGNKGDQGPSGTMTVGTVTTLPEGSDATVTNSGTVTNAVLNFGIPRGDTGHFDADFIADYFDTEKNYHINDYVIYGSYLYRFVSEHPAGAWDDDDAVQIALTDDLTHKADSQAIADEFQPFKAYNAYDYVMYNGRLYQFTTAHGSGSWNPSEVTQINYTVFDSTADYAVGDYVVYEDVLYQFTSAHSGSDWDANDATAITSTTFATGTAYAVGDYVTYNDNLYQYTSAHSDGAWNASEASQLTITAFDADNAYSVGDYVTYNDTLYKFTEIHENGGWDADDVTKIEPTAFDTDTDYSVGDYVTYNDGLYRFTSEHSSGVWDSDFVTEIPFTAFEENTAYAEGDCVTYNNNYYIFNTAHTSGAWNNSETTPILTRAFLTGTAYAIDDYVTYNNGYYRFTTAHPNGAWNAEEVKPITVESFATGTAYETNTYVLKDGRFYKFTANHSDGAWDETEVRSANAVEFSEDDYYIVGKIVFYDGAYYCFTVTHTAGEWDASQVNEIEAEDFNEADNYAIGDYVVLGDNLYFFTSAHTGSGWNPNEVEEITMNTFNNQDTYSINDYVSNNDYYYQYVTNHEGSAWNSAQVEQIQADAFSTTTDYAVGEFVVYSGNLYRFLTPHTGSTWNANEVAVLTVNAFSSANDYVIDDYVLYNSKLWVFTAPKQSGAWRSTEASEIEYDAFDVTENYSVGDYVEYEDDVYQFTNDHSNGHWDSTQLVEIEYDEFDDTEDYNAGDYVAYEGDIYIFTSAHVGSEWNDSEVTQISYDEFSTLTDYAVGDYVAYEGNVYRFTLAHAGGAFDNTEVTEIEYDDFGDKSYTIGDYVAYEGDIYQFTSAHTGSEWDASEVQELSVLDIQSGSGIIGSEFDETATYAVGDYVVYSGSLYRFTSAHEAGAWDSSQVALVTVTDEFNRYLPTSGGTLSGDLLFSTNGDTGTRQIRMAGGSNDFGRVAVGATGNNAGWMEIATADDGTEPIYVRQYTGVYSTITRTLTLLDASGNTTIPGRLTVNGKISLPTSGGSWVSQKDTNNAPIKITTEAVTDGSRYDSIIGGTSKDGSSWNMGIIDNKIYFGRYVSSQTANSFTSSVAIDLVNGYVSKANTANDSAKLNGYASDTAATANTIVRRQANGYIYATYYNASCGVEATTSYSGCVPAFFSTDGWLRKSNFQAFRQSMFPSNMASSAGYVITINDSWQTGGYIPKANVLSWAGMTYSTTDLTAGSSNLTTGNYYFVYV